jgi:hypothetical protein
MARGRTRSVLMVTPGYTPSDRESTGYMKRNIFVLKIQPIELLYVRHKQPPNTVGHTPFLSRRGHLSLHSFSSPFVRGSKIIDNRLIMVIVDTNRCIGIPSIIDIKNLPSVPFRRISFFHTFSARSSTHVMAAAASTTATPYVPLYVRTSPYTSMYVCSSLFVYVRPCIDIGVSEACMSRSHRAPLRASLPPPPAPVSAKHPAIAPSPPKA